MRFGFFLNRDSSSRYDFTLIIVVTVLIAFGCLMIYSAGFDSIEKINKGFYQKQIIWFVIGFILMILLTLINYQQLGDYALHIYGFLLVVLILTTIFGTPIRNTRAWLNLGFFSIQPSEFMKLSVVIVLAKYLELRERDMRNFRELLIPSLVVLIPMGIILKQPDFGTAVIFVPVLFTMLYVGGADVSHLLSIIAIAAIALIVPMILTYREWVGAEGSNFILEFFKDVSLLSIVSGILLFIAIISFIFHFFIPRQYLRRIYIPSTVVSLGFFLSVVIQNFFKTYQKKRILVFLNPDLDPHGSGYNIIQSKIAIGSGGFFGKGFLKGSQSQLGFLPEKTSDFIFSVVAEEMGFIGALFMLVLFGYIIFKGIQTALDSKDKFGSMLASGISAIFFFHLLINVGMVIGIMPVTGLPLTFVSYGGSNLIMAMIGVGIILNIRMRKY